MSPLHAAAALIFSVTLGCGDTFDPSPYLEQRTLEQLKPVKINVNARARANSFYVVFIHPTPPAHVGGDYEPPDCPVIDAGGSLNGVPMELHAGSAKPYQNFMFNTESGVLCDDPGWSFRPSTDAHRSALASDRFRIRLADDSGEIRLEVAADPTTPTVRVEHPADGRLIPGEEIELRIDPMPRRMGDWSVSFRLDDRVGNEFHLSNREVEWIETGVRFVMPNADAGAGTLTFHADGFYRPEVFSCEGAETCEAELALVPQDKQRALGTRAVVPGP